MRGPCAFVLVCLTAAVCAQRPILIADLERSPLYEASPSAFTYVGGTLFFIGATKATGIELFASAQGIKRPYLVKDVVPGPTSSIPRDLRAMSGRLYFVVKKELWTSDGTTKGTRRTLTLAQDINLLETVGNRLFLFTQNEVWVGDGTPAGTTRVPGTFYVKQTTATATRLAFRNRGNPDELWWSDGTVKGTTKSSHTTTSLVGTLGSRFLFVDSTWQRRLWITDGTPKGTTSLGTVLATHGVEWQGKFFLRARAGNDSYLWVTDGTLAGTKQLAHFPRIYDFHLVAAGRRFFFNAADQLWTSDGTKSGTRRIVSGLRNWTLGTFGDRAIFTRFDGTHGHEPWVSDGTTVGTHLLADIHPGFGGSAAYGYRTLPNGYVAFTATDGTTGTELWASDGTARNTFLVGDLNPSPVPNRSSTLNTHEDHAGLVLLHSKHDPRGEIFVTDGTRQRTQRIAQGHHHELSAASLGADILVGSTRRLSSRIEYKLLRLDGHTLRTTTLRTYSKAPPTALTRLVDDVYFGASDNNRSGLWRTDGSARGTVFVASPMPRSAVTVGNRVYLFAADNRIYESDGTTTGTKPLTAALSTTWHRLRATRTAAYLAEANALWRLTPGKAQKVTDAKGNVMRSGTGWCEWRGEVFFGGHNGTYGGLWRSDGTASGTRQVHAIAPLEIAAADDRLFFIGNDNRIGRELWTSDGTTSGTRLVRDLAPGWDSGVLYSRTRSLAVIGRHVYFTGRTAGHRTDSELWCSDGSSAGTRLVYELRPGLLGSAPTDYVVSNGSLLFIADDGVHGREPFRLEVGAHAASLGPGCSLTTPPRVTASPPTLGKTLTLRVDQPRARPGVLVLGVKPPRPVAAGAGCTIHIESSCPHVLVPFWKTTSFRLTAPLPNLPFLHGTSLVAQAAVGPTNQGPLGFDLSNGLLLALRR